MKIQILQTKIPCDKKDSRCEEDPKSIPIQLQMNLRKNRPNLDYFITYESNLIKISSWFLTYGNSLISLLGA